uniref:C-type lectin domain-containing protein n=1 Tax=Leptobrachium leishanense TaxID=445787 RepID=A0A8C5QJV6_9ANUR
MSSETKEKIVLNIYENSMSTDGNNQLDNEECYTDVYHTSTTRALPDLPLREEEEGEAAAAGGLYIWRKDKPKLVILALAVGLVLMFLLWLILIILVFTYYSAISSEIRDVMGSNSETIQEINQILQAQENLRVEIQEQRNTVSQILQAQENLREEIQKQSNTGRGDVSCPSSWKCIGKSGYFFSTATVTWDEANTDCSSRQAQLLVLANKGEMDALVPHMDGKPYWIGLKKIVNNWTWHNGLIPSFTSWNPNEPNNAGGRENCVEMKSGLWNDIDCTIKLAYICKSIWFY